MESGMKKIEWCFRGLASTVIDMSRTRSQVLQPTWGHAFVTFNNQDSVIMSMDVPKDELLCLLHDNRIFAFKRQASETTSSSSDEQNVMLNLLTTPKYRIMSSMYIIFRLLDNTGLVLLIILSIMKWQLTIPSSAQMVLVSALGLEVVYDVMLFTHKFWILQRLSLFIGLSMYIFYAGLIYWNFSIGAYTSNDLQIVCYAVLVRFCAFLFEEFVDIAIDGQLHNDLLKLKNPKIDVQNNEEQQDMQNSEEQPVLQNNELQPIVQNNEDEPNASCCCSNFKKYIKSYIDVSNSVMMPRNVHYEGSFFAWSPYSVFNENVWSNKQFPRPLIIFLCLIPASVAVLLIFLITLIFIIPALIILFFVSFCLLICNSTCTMRILLDSARKFFKELMHV